MKKGQTNNPNGRPKGSMNKRTQQLFELAQEHDADPFMFLVNVMKGNKKEFPEVFEDPESGEERISYPNLDFETRMEAAKELMPYLYGKRRPVDKDGDDSDPLSAILDRISGREEP